MRAYYFLYYLGVCHLMSILTGKKIIVTGVANKKSIAWGCAKAIAEQGAEIIYTYQNDRMKRNLVRSMVWSIRLLLPTKKNYLAM